MATPLSIEHLERVGSTQDEAFARFSDGAVLVTATGQDAGRGRTGHTWLDADVSLAASLAFASRWPGDRLPVVTLVAGLAVLDLLPSRVSLKWPNDIVVEADKVGGILTESRDGVVLVGFGLNVHWADPPSGMGAMHDRDPGVDHVRAIAQKWAEALLIRVAHGPDEWGRDEYVTRCSTLGREITWEPSGSGRAVWVAHDGALIVDTGRGLVELRSGAVREVRPA